MAPPPLEVCAYPTIAKQVARRLATHREGVDPLAPWQEEVVVPSAGMAAAISAALLEEFPAGVAGLRIQTLETLARRIVNGARDYPRVADESERRLAMRVATRRITDPLLDTRGAASMLERSYRDLRDSGTTVAEMARRAAGARLRNRKRTQTAVEAWIDYESLIEQLGAVDPAALLARAAGVIRNGSAVAPQIAAGFYDVTGAQMNLLDALHARGRLAAVFVPGDQEAPQTFAFAQPLISHFGKPLQSEPLQRSSPARWSIAAYETRESEMRAACSEIATLLESGARPASIGITARAFDAYHLHLLDRFSAAAGFAISTPPPIPLTAHRFGRAVTHLLRLREHDFRRSDVLEIARSGLTLRTKIDPDIADAETRSAQIAGGRASSLRPITDRSPLLRRYADLVGELESLTATVDAGWLSRIAALFRLETETDRSALEEIRQIADRFVRAAIWGERIDEALLIDAVESAEIRPGRRNPEGPTVWTGDVMKLRGRTFDHLFAVRMQDDVLPQHRTEDPLLPDADRRLLGVREIGDGRDEEQLLFRVMAGAANDSIRFTFASSDGFGKPLRASQLLKQLAIELDPSGKQEVLKDFVSWVGRKWPARPEPLADRPLPASITRALQSIVRSGSRGRFDGYVSSPAVLERAAAAVQSLSPTQLEDFGECPQKFFWKHILRVRDLDDPEHEVQINHRDKGIVDHAILERFYRSLDPAEIGESEASLPRLGAGIVERLETMVDEQFDELERRMPPYNLPMRRIERESTKRNLRQFVANDFADLIEAHLVPIRFEYRFGERHRRGAPDHPEPFVVDAGGAALRVEGTIDRIDQGAGGLRVVDYKSGKAARHKDLAKKIYRGVRLQLPLYAMAAADFFNVAPDAVSGAIKPVGGSLHPEHFAFNLAEREATLRETLAVFVSAIAAGHFPAFPNENDNDFNSCKYCPVAHSCRTKHDTDERRRVLRAREPRSLLTEAPE